MLFRISMLLTVRMQVQVAQRAREGQCVLEARRVGRGDERGPLFAHVFVIAALVGD